jgi:hypothetical protein
MAALVVLRLAIGGAKNGNKTRALRVSDPVTQIMVSNKRPCDGWRFLRFKLIRIFVNLGLSFSPEAEALFSRFAEAIKLRPSAPM